MFINSTKGTQEIVAPRGEIVDINGNSLVKNKLTFDVIIENAFFPTDKQEQNEIILNLSKLLEQLGVEWEDCLPISKTKPYQYLDDKSNIIDNVLKDLRLNDYATAENCIDALIKKYEISDKYTDEEIRTISGIRYGMIYSQFSVSNRFVFAKDIPKQHVSIIKERSFLYPGVDISETAVRVYPNGTIFPHGLGTVGPIYAEEYKQLKELGYRLDDQIGKSGIEKIMEDELRGENGTRSVLLGSKNRVVSIEETKPAVPGDTVVLTIDSEFQKKTQDILEYHIKWLNETQTDPDKGMNAYGGAIVVLDIKSGAVKAMASYPSYDINDYSKNFSELNSAEHNPLFNRALDGLYRPGSTFKMIVATAALNEGIIDENTTVFCNKIYTYYPDYQPKCLKYHGEENVKTALRDSCNIFFYDVGRRLGITKLAEYEEMYGYGTNLGFELGGKTGQIASPDTFKKINRIWGPGDVLQASIGQSEIAVTPLHMAVYASTIANKGVRYHPYIVDSVWNYDRTELISKNAPKVDYTIEDKKGDTFDIITEGMVMAAETIRSYPGDTSTLPYPMAVKSGTPQSGSGHDNSACVGFYPADNPEIAFSVMVEDGWNAKMTAKKIVQAYYGLDVVQDDQISIVD